MTIPDETADRPVAGDLPRWPNVLVVVAHPDDESFGLGAVIDAFVSSLSTVSVLCLTSGEASTLGARPDLAQVRAGELETAARSLGVSHATLCGWPDGGLAQIDSVAVQADIVAAVAQDRPDGLVVFDPSGITGHPDHRTATRHATVVAAAAGLPVLAWTLPVDVTEQLNGEYGTAFVGHAETEVDVRLRVTRQRQRRAIAAHRSQAVPGSVLWRRLDLQGDREVLRWVLPPTVTGAPVTPLG